MTQVQRNRLDPRVEIKWGSSGRYATRKHAHAEISIGAVIQGNTEVWIAKQGFHLSPGQFILIPPEVPHLCQPDPHQPFEFWMLYLDPSLGLEIGNTEGNERLLRCLQVGLVPAEILIQLGQQLVAAQSPQEWPSLLDQIQELVLSRSTYSMPCEARVPLSEPGILKTLHPPQPSTDQSRYQSRYQIFRTHKQIYGLGQQGIRQIQRIERSKQLLRRGESVATTALDCGFFDQSHYTKTFRMYTGLTPAQFQLGLQRSH